MTETATIEERPQPASVATGLRFYGGGFPPDTHPLIQGLFQTLPTPGMAWPNERREQWLNTARAIFGLIFTAPDEDAPPSNLNRHVGAQSRDMMRSE